jgi:hypothetical protein
MRRMISVAVLVLAAAVAGGPVPEAMQAIESPAPAGSFAPQLSRTRDGAVLFSWLETLPAKQHRFRAARLKDGAWSPAFTLVENAPLFANWADVPSVSEQGGRLFAHWLQKSGTGTYAYHVMVRSSGDNGKTWSTPVIAHNDRSETEHGFVSFFQRPDSKAGLAWLDGRATGGGHSGHGGGAMTLRAAALNAGGTSGEVLLDGRVCDCCPTAAIATQDAVLVAYRDRSPDEIRDISVVRYAGGRWSEPVTMNDGWKIGGCPVNGPALAAEGKRVALAWFTGANDKPAVKLAHSTDSGRRWSAPVVLSSGIPLGRVSVAITSDGATHVAWLDHNGGDGRLLVRRIDTNGTIGEAQTLTSMKTDRASGFPRMLADGTGMLYAWTEIGPDRATRVRIARR